MSDIVERLRQYRPRDEWGDPVQHWICNEAADAIERLEARATAAEATVTALQEALAKAEDTRDCYEEILRCVCHHLELPQSESGPADDLRLYDRALEAADLYTRQADKDLAENKDLRFKAEAEAFRLREALERAETDRAEQWRLRRDAEGSRDAARAAADSLRIERDILRTVLSDISEGWDFWQVNPHDREPPRDAISRARTALSQIRSEK